MHDLILYIQSYLDSDKTPGGAGNIFWATVYILLVFGGLSVAVIAMNWLERKILAHMQVRLGPMRLGPHGLLQPIADAIKLLLKEDIIPAEADKVVFWIAPFIVVLAAFTVFVVVPFGPTHAITDMNIGIRSERRHYPRRGRQSCLLDCAVHRSAGGVHRLRRRPFWPHARDYRHEHRHQI